MVLLIDCGGYYQKRAGMKKAPAQAHGAVTSKKTYSYTCAGLRHGNHLDASVGKNFFSPTTGGLW
jgi:hypothetical protein